MCLRREELAPGAYVADPTTNGLYEVGLTVQNVVKLIDVKSPIDDPHLMSLLLPAALKRLELVRAAPHVDETASIEEWGGLNA